MTNRTQRRAVERPSSNTASPHTLSGSVSIRRVLTSVLAFTVAILLANECLAGDDIIKWRAPPYMDITRSSTNCGSNHREPVDIEFDGHVVRTTGWTGHTYEVRLLEPLAADGSGQVYGVRCHLIDRWCSSSSADKAHEKSPTGVVTLRAADGSSYQSSVDDLQAAQMSVTGVTQPS